MDQLKRIAHMEQLYDQSSAAVEAMLQAMQQYRAAKDGLRALSGYYQGPEWMQDFLDDRAGRIPKDMKRGILTEDAIWDLLTDHDRMMQLLRQLAED